MSSEPKKKKRFWEIIGVKFIYNSLNLNRDKINYFEAETDPGKGEHVARHGLLT